MIHSESPYTIEQYLLPEYWNGHTLGQGDYYVAEPISFTLGKPFVRQTMKNFLSQGKIIDAFALSSYGHGETFDPADHEVGTIVRCRTELLFGKDGVVVDVASLEGIPLPPPEAIAHKANRMVLIQPEEDEYANDVYYAAENEWGIIADTSEGRGLIGISEIVLFGIALGKQTKSIKVPRHRFWFANTKPLTVGEVEHRKHRTFQEREIVSRINSIDICAQGAAQKGSSKVWGTIGRVVGRLGLIGSS
ncbi:MAG TPA: hypothetical protein VF733_03370 [Candidatus Saccharimonadales bacterium]